MADRVIPDVPDAPVAPGDILVICGSPRKNGRSARLARELADGLAAANPGRAVRLLAIAGADVHGCIGCDACRDAGVCAFDDDMGPLMAALDAADELHLVSPVYFAGPPSQLKAVLDRLQPHYWKGTRALPKQPAHLHVVGEGGDPHGFEPLVVICRSALAVAGFELVAVTPHIVSAARSAVQAEAGRDGAPDGE
ncbi:MAG: flavodoxin family protein [Coriobacteriaceae bacterium]|nr:flavodoxin family protein [Coriobacteriaceae bacterium]